MVQVKSSLWHPLRCVVALCCDGLLFSGVRIPSLLTAQLGVGVMLHQDCSNSTIPLFHGHLCHTHRMSPLLMNQGWVVRKGFVFEMLPEKLY